MNKKIELRGIILVLAYIFMNLTTITIKIYDFLGLKSGVNIFIGNFTILFFISLILYSKEFKECWIYIFKNPLKVIGQTILLTIFIIVLNSILLKIFKTPQSQNEKIVRQLTRQIPIVVNILITCLFVPFLEEILYRHILIGELSKKIPIFIAVIISMAMFICVHSIRFPECLAYLPITLALTFIYLKSGKNIKGSYPVHMLNNLLACVLTTFLK